MYYIVKRLIGLQVLHRLRWRLTKRTYILKTSSWVKEI